jgi:hypothetical protein
MNYPVIKLYQQHLIVYVKPFSVRVVYEEVGSRKSEVRSRKSEVGSNKLFGLRTSDF